MAETVCSICDDGGNVIYCDGPCSRLFHLTKGDSPCPTVGLSEAEADHIDKYYCPNCTLNIHQCFACGKLGRSAGDAQEVFPCRIQMCGHFYHASCVTKLILKVKEDTSDPCTAMIEAIKAGQLDFSCPTHRCQKCSGEEELNVSELQFGICRRCPRAWHRKCLPRSIVYPDADEPQRAWDNLLPNRILIYCERHPIIPELGTPARNHVKFPSGFKQSSQNDLVKSEAQSHKKMRILTKLVALKKRDRVDLPNGLMGQKSPKLLKHFSGQRLKPSALIGKNKPAVFGILNNQGDRHASAPPLRVNKSPLRVNKSQPSAVFMIKRKANLGSSVAKQDVCNTKSTENGSMQKHKVALLPNPKIRDSAMICKTQVSAQLSRKCNLLVEGTAKLDTQARSLVSGIIERAKLSVTLECVMKKYVVPACYKGPTIKFDEKYSLAKIEPMVKEIRSAIEVLRSGGTFEDAKEKCSADCVKFVQACQKDLGVFLCPFLHGDRFTSYGRHFTLPAKLAEIVERVHWYIKEGDMVVDFCCGFNHFSMFVKQKLEQTGKRCEFKNFDLIQTNNIFNFTKGDWFDVKQDQLPDGNRLVMGLNPPFSLANQFIRHALTFKPKLLVLIVPKATERLDQKYRSYDLIWEDDILLSGKSFFLPGSVDVDEQALEDWNKSAPLLYIWSRSDWTFLYREIALEKGHITPFSKVSYFGNQLHNTSIPIPSLSDFVLEEDMENGAGEGSNLDQNKSDVAMVEAEALTKSMSETITSDVSVVEPILVNMTSDVHEAGGNRENIPVMSGRSTELLECSNVEGSDLGSANVPVYAVVKVQRSNLVKKDGSLLAAVSEGCDNLLPQENDDGRPFREGQLESLEKARLNCMSDDHVCRQVEKADGGTDEPHDLVDENSQLKGNHKKHLPSMETVRGDKGAPFEQESLDAAGKKLPKGCQGQRDKLSLMASKHKKGLSGKSFDSSVAKGMDGFEIVMQHCKQGSDHSNVCQRSLVSSAAKRVDTYKKALEHCKQASSYSNNIGFSQTNPSNKNMYCPQRPLGLLRQDMQNVPMSKGYGCMVQKTHTVYNMPEAPTVSENGMFQPQHQMQTQYNSQEAPRVNEPHQTQAQYNRQEAPIRLNGGTFQPLTQTQYNRPEAPRVNGNSTVQVPHQTQAHYNRQETPIRLNGGTFEPLTQTQYNRPEAPRVNGNNTYQTLTQCNRPEAVGVNGNGTCNSTYQTAHQTFTPCNRPEAVRVNGNGTCRMLHQTPTPYSRLETSRLNGIATFQTPQQTHTQYNRPEILRVNGDGRIQMPHQTQGLLGSRAGGVSAVPHNGLQSPHDFLPRGWTGIITRPDPAVMHPSAPRSSLRQYQAPSGMHNPSLSNTQDLRVGGHAGPPRSSVLGCPPGKQRLPGQAHWPVF